MALSYFGRILVITLRFIRGAVVFWSFGENTVFQNMIQQNQNIFQCWDKWFDITTSRENAPPVKPYMHRQCCISSEVGINNWIRHPRPRRFGISKIADNQVAVWELGTSKIGHHKYQGSVRNFRRSEHPRTVFSSIGIDNQKYPRSKNITFPRVA